jgi:hypothetical protein
MKNEIQHPVAIGTLTNIGTIANWKYVRFGFGKYRYFTLEGKYGHEQDEITEIYKSKDQENEDR